MLKNFIDEPSDTYQDIKCLGVNALLRKKNDGRYMFRCQELDLFSEINAESFNDAIMKIKHEIKNQKLVRNKARI